MATWGTSFHEDASTEDASTETLSSNYGDLPLLIGS